MMEIYLPRNTLAPMPQPTVTTFLVPCHKAPHWCALLYPVVVVTSMHQCGGTLCLQYCRISQTHPGKHPTHCLLEDDSGSSNKIIILSCQFSQRNVRFCWLGAEL